MECFRTSSSFLNHRISPLARKYEPPRLSLFWLERRQANRAASRPTRPATTGPYRPAETGNTRRRVFVDLRSDRPCLHTARHALLRAPVPAEQSGNSRSAKTRRSRPCRSQPGRSPPGMSQANPETDAHLVAQATTAAGRRSPPAARRRPSIGRTQFVFEFCLSHANRIQGRRIACLNHSSLFKVNVKSGPSLFLVGRGGCTRRPVKGGGESPAE